MNQKLVFQFCITNVGAQPSFKFFLVLVRSLNWLQSLELIFLHPTQPPSVDQSLNFLEAILYFILMKEHFRIIFHLKPNSMTSITNYKQVLMLFSHKWQIKAKLKCNSILFWCLLVFQPKYSSKVND